MYYYWKKSDEIKSCIFIPKYYDPTIQRQLNTLSITHECRSIRELFEAQILEVSTGDEIGKLAYGTGDIPFLRTSDISNWEIKSAPKQGVSEDVYVQYAASQDVQVGDVLLVRDGTYLIGTNCIVSRLDAKMLFQSHILKLRAVKEDKLTPQLLFLLLNTGIVQRQIRSIQFTADTIDTIGNRYLDIVLPFPKEIATSVHLVNEVSELLDVREKGRAFIKHCPVIMEEALVKSSISPIEEFVSQDWQSIADGIKTETVSSEFGQFQTNWLGSDAISQRIFLPKYYGRDIVEELKKLQKTCVCMSIGELVQDKALECKTGDEVGKLAYGTGDIPFVRTSDFANWELKYNPKQSVSEEIYRKYDNVQDVQTLDILLVRDGTYLIGNSCIITQEDTKMLYCGGIYKIRVLKREVVDPWLLLGLLNSYIVKRQIRTKQFTRDVIDTLGKRLDEVILPIPRSAQVRKGIADRVESIALERISARRRIEELANNMA